MEGGQNSHDHMFQESWDQSETSSSSIGEDSDASNRSSSITSSDTVDDASSSSSSSLCDLSEIMEQLPIKRGLSQFYQGKSESFTSLSRVTSIEDLMKKSVTTTPSRRNLKASKSCRNGLHSYKMYTLPKAVIAKKSSRGVSSLSSFPSKRGGVVINSKPPLR